MYKIQYSAMSPKKYSAGKRRRFCNGWIKPVIGIFLLLSIFFARKYLQSVIFSGGAEETDIAAERMVQAMKDGDSLYEAVSAFCLEVIENGQQD